MQYRYAVNCAGMTPANEIVKHSVVLPFWLMATYGGAICAVMNGVSAEAAFKKLRVA